MRILLRLSHHKHRTIKQRTLRTKQHALQLEPLTKQHALQLEPLTKQHALQLEPLTKQHALPNKLRANLRTQQESLLKVSRF
jgi:hypothetical protein